MSDLSQRLAQLRQMNGMSQDALAAQVRVTPQVIMAWESGDTAPDAPELIALADVYHASLDELVGRRPAEPGYQGQELAPVEYDRAPVPRQDPAPFAPVAQGRWVDRLNSIPMWALWAGLPFLLTFIYVTCGVLFNAWEYLWVIFPLYPVICFAALVLRRKPKQ